MTDAAGADGRAMDYTDPGTGTPEAAWTPVLAGLAPEPLTLPRDARLLVVSAHPDDETLGAGGVIALATRAGLDVSLLCASDGTGSHPRSPSHTPEQLAARRAEEYVAAARELGVPGSSVRQLDLPDGSIADHVAGLTAVVAELVETGRLTLLASTWTEDGHPDHEAVGRAVAAAARRTGVAHWQFPVWFWHGRAIDDPRLASLRPVPVDEEARAAKRRAVAAHVSQVTPLSSAAGDETLLDAAFLAHFDRAQEWFVAD